MGNQTILTGNMGNDPEIFYGGGGDPVASFNLAFNSGKDKTGWIRVVAFKKQAEVVEKYLHKGARIIVFGRLDYQEWETDSKEKRRGLQIIAESFEFIRTDGRGFENSDRPPF